MPKCGVRAGCGGLPAPSARAGDGRFEAPDAGPCGAEAGAQQQQQLAAFWRALPTQRRRELLSVDRRELFTHVRQQFCSRCYGLFVLRYEEAKGSPAELDCPACQEYYAGLQVSAASGAIGVEPRVLEGDELWALFAAGAARERERELQFGMTGDICGSGFQKRPGGPNMCALHCSPVPVEALIAYFGELPAEHRGALLTLREEDFVAELDSALKYQLRICKDCRWNCMQSYRDLKPSARASPGEAPALELAPGCLLRVGPDRLVTVEGDAAAAAEFLHRAEDVECCKDLEAGGSLDGGEAVRHAETPELAREALVDCALLVFRGQVEVAFREQTAGHNALLLFVGLALRLMRARLGCAFAELGAAAAEAELLDLVAREKERSQASGRKKGKARKADKAPARPPGPEPPQPPPPLQCRECAQLQAPAPQAGGRGGSPRQQQQQPAPVSHVAAQARAAAAAAELEAAGGWEVQPAKRRGLQQAGRKAGAAGSGGSRTPERARRASQETPRSRSPFARRPSPASHPKAAPAPHPAPTPGQRQQQHGPQAAAKQAAPQPQPPPPPPADAPKQQQRQPAAVPARTVSSAAVGFAPPPPPPPRDTRRGSRAATEQPQQQVPPPPPAGRPAGWTPWSVRSTVVAAPPGGCAPHPQQPTPRANAWGQAKTEPDGFSLFHFPPVPRSDGGLPMRAAPAAAGGGYQLFGGGGGPLPPLAPVLSL